MKPVLPEAKAPRRPELTFPPAEAEVVRACYAGAEAILEYGSGGSTLLGAEMPGKTVISVESDRAWHRMMEDWFAANPPRAQLVLHYARIGATKEWGMPVSDEGWRNFHRYPLGVWSLPGFVHPDVVLIDGRFRLGCLLATAYLIERPVTVMFDDYASRPRYAEVEEFLRPDEMVGRMAIYRLAPRPFPVRALARIMELTTRPL